MSCNVFWAVYNMYKKNFRFLKPNLKSITKCQNFSQISDIFPDLIECGNVLGFKSNFSRNTILSLWCPLSAIQGFSFIALAAGHSVMWVGQVLNSKTRKHTEVFRISHRQWPSVCFIKLPNCVELALLLLGCGSAISFIVQCVHVCILLDKQITSLLAELLVLWKKRHWLPYLQI